jgi:thiosulfate reductase cytochrome b subunit
MQTSPSPVRHDLVPRILHWLNALLITVALMTGLQILNAHPQLYWGESGNDSKQAVLEIYPLSLADGSVAGRLRIGNHVFATTGVLGVSADAEGGPEFHAFPAWATIPGRLDLASGRKWHFIVAWLLVFSSSVFLMATARSGHLRREILPRPNDLAPARLLGDVRKHLLMRLEPDKGGVHYNPLQKLAYSIVILLLGPLLLATGLTMSPGLDAAWPWLPELFGGRQSARTLHFVIHIIMVAVSNPVEQIRAMITGRFTSASPG